RFSRDWSSDVCSSDLNARLRAGLADLAVSGAFRRAVVCTHGFLMRRFLQELDPVEPPRIVPNGLVAEISFSADGGFRLERLHERSEERRVGKGERTAR